MSACTDLPAAVGFALGLYFQITQTGHWVRFFSTRLQNPDRKGRALAERFHRFTGSSWLCFGFVFSNHPNQPLGSFCQAARNPQTLGSLRETSARPAQHPPSEPRP
jgi:hypothetical protein